ncbi:hypothetical protein BH09ACT10_BH09ACT10_07270 [soil metagenome]
MATTTTEADGTFVFPPAVPGDYDVVLDLPSELEAVGADSIPNHAADNATDDSPHTKRADRFTHRRRDH